jgi:hypothetical protein
LDYDIIQVNDFVALSSGSIPGTDDLRNSHLFLKSLENGMTCEPGNECGDPATLLITVKAHCSKSGTYGSVSEKSGDLGISALTKRAGLPATIPQF